MQTLSVLAFALVLSLGWTYPVEKGQEIEARTPKVDIEPVAYPKYHFEYGVKDDTTGDIKEQTEDRDGDLVKGEYSLIEPDGTVRRVQYQDDGKTGFQATVTRSGPKTYPPSKVALPRAVPVVVGPFHQ